MRVTATIDTRAAVRGVEQSQAHEIEVEAGTYEDGREQLQNQVPEGWIMVSIGVPDRVDFYRGADGGR